MASENAKRVARKVSETIGKRKKVVFGEIIKEVGYSESTSKSPQLVIDTKSYRDEITPFINKLKRERDRQIQALLDKNLDKEKYRDIVDGLDKFTKNIQLLEGKATSNVKVNDFRNLTDDELIAITTGEEGTGTEGTGEEKPA